MKGTNILAGIADFIGDTFERLSPAMFRMLSTLLPYLTPLPVAYLTAHSAAQFLEMDARIAGILVFILEGIGLWATTELVDSFVDAIRTKNKKAWGIVIFLAVVVIVYISILVTLNVVLEHAINHKGGAYSLVLTLICFLPLLSGALNGYRKVKMETKTNIQMAKEHQEVLDAQVRAEKNDLKLKSRMIKAGLNPFATAPTMTLNSDTEQSKDIREKHASDYREKAVAFIEEYYAKNHQRPSPKHLTERFGLDHTKNKGYMSSLIKEVCDSHGW
jgi:hypothetical protein